MIERGMGNDEIEKALNEEESVIKESSEQKEIKEEIVSVEETSEDKVEKTLDNTVESIEKNTEVVSNKLQEVGGDEGVQKTLDAMTFEKKKELSEKITALSEKIKYRKGEAKYEFIDAIPFSHIADNPSAQGIFGEVALSVLGAKTIFGVMNGIKDLSQMFKLKKERRALIKAQNKLG